MKDLKTDLHAVITAYVKMTELVEYAEKHDYEIIWDYFWEVNNTIPIKIDSYDPNGSYEDDIYARYKAVKEFIEEYCDLKGWGNGTAYTD